MTIKLEKEESLEGNIWYKVWVDNTCVKCFSDSCKGYDTLPAEEGAKQYYEKLLERAKLGFPKTETIESNTIQTP